jgi:hypothetical protein
MNDNQDVLKPAGSNEPLPTLATVPISNNPGAKPVSIPRGLEVLLKKASVDPEFKELLLVSRAEASAFIGLKLELNEILMLQAAPTDQLEAVIAQTQVPQEHRRAFLGRAAAAMLAALGIVSTESGCIKGHSVKVPYKSPGGKETDPIPPTEDLEGRSITQPGASPKPEENRVAPTGIRPDRPPSAGVPPER